MNLFKKLMSIAMSSVLALSTVVNAAGPVLKDASNLKAFKKTNQGYVHVKSDGGKYTPWINISRPDINKFDAVLCGTYDSETQTYGLTKDSSQIATMTPVWVVRNWADLGTGKALKSDFKFQGYAETYGQQAVAGVFRIGWDDTYKGSLCIQEYREGFPFEFTIRQEDIAPLATYLKNQFAANNVAPLAELPPLLIDIAGGFDFNALDTDTQTFLTTYFTLVDTYDPAVKNFYESSAKRLLDMQSAGKDAVYIMDTLSSFGQRFIDDKAQKWDWNKKIIPGLVATTAAAGTAYILYKLASKATQPVQSQVDALLNGAKTPEQIRASKPANAAQMDELIAQMQQLNANLSAAG